MSVAAVFLTTDVKIHPSVINTFISSSENISHLENEQKTLFRFSVGKGGVMVCF